MIIYLCDICAFLLSVLIFIFIYFCNISVISGPDSSASLIGCEISSTSSGPRRNRSLLFESTIPMEIAQLLLSLLLGWGLDVELDGISEARLGLLKPLVPISFGQISRGYMSLMSPTWKPATKTKLEDVLKITSTLSQRVKWFTSRTHWEISNSMVRMTFFV